MAGLKQPFIVLRTAPEAPKAPKAEFLFYFYFPTNHWLCLQWHNNGIPQIRNKASS